MTITTLDQLIAAQKHTLSWFKTSTRTLVGGAPYNLDGVTGFPTGTLNVGNTAAGIVPTGDGTYGPLMPSFSATPYISKIMFSSNVSGTIRLYDRLFCAGAYAYNADVTLASQPDFDARYETPTGLELWVEQVTANTGTLSVQVNYLDQGGNAGDTGAIACPVATAPIGRMWRLPLAAGDSGIYGVNGIVRVRGSVASGGTFNVSVMRPLWAGRVAMANYSEVVDFLKTGLPRIYATTCLWASLEADSTAVGLPYVNIQIADG